MFCSLDGKQKSYCTPEAYRGETCWLFRNRGNGTFEDVTATCGIFDSSSKSLGVALLDYDQDGWPDIFVANDTQPNKLYRNLRNGTFQDVALEAGVALSEDGKARAGMGVDAADFDNSGRPGLAVTNFDNEMIGLYRPQAGGAYLGRVAAERASGSPHSTGSASAACSPISISTARSISSSPTATSTRPCATSAATSATRRRRSSSSTRATRRFATSPAWRAAASRRPRVGRGLACGDFDRDGDVDLLMTTNNGPAVLFRNDQTAGNRSLRLRLIGTKSNRDAIGATVRIFHGGTVQSRVVRSGSSYLSQSELPVTFGVGKRDASIASSITWPNGRAEEFARVATGKQYDCIEGKGISESPR